jgi:cytoskeletal protein CcmA (bactofilin family)
MGVTALGGICMWKSWKDEEKPGTAEAPEAPRVPSPSVGTRETASSAPLKTPEPLPTGTAHIGSSVVINGELSGSEDLYLDGHIEGSIELQGNSLTIGPNGRVKANIQARAVIIHGNVEGNVVASDRVELTKTAVLAGDVVTQRIAIQDGAYFKGSIDVHKETKPEKNAKPEPKREPLAAAVAVGATATKEPGK